MAPWHQRYARMVEEQRPPSNAFTSPCVECGVVGTRKRARPGDGRLHCEYRLDCSNRQFKRRPVFGRPETGLFRVYINPDNEMEDLQ